jgi:D-alanine-D-alanine ligase
VKLKRVAVICGGRSSEHEISCISASGVLSAINRELFEPVLIGISKAGDWVLLSSASDFGKGDSDLPMVPARESNLTIDKQGIHKSSGENLNIDVVFPLLHGAYGEDGTIQGLLEMIGIPYVGSGVLASSVAMDKTFAKPIYADFGLKVSDGITIHKRDWQQNKELELAKITALGLPIFVKPARSGSSRGTSKVSETKGIEQAINFAFQFDPRALVETAIVGREIECAVLEIEGKPAPSILGEIKVKPPHEFYDFEAKYLDGSTTFELPANLPDSISEKIKSAAVTAFLALGCEGLARVDFFLADSGEIVINELNTMPGFTPRSVFPMLWEATGKSYPELITQLITSALQRSQHVIR